MRLLCFINFRAYLLAFKSDFDFTMFICSCLNANSNLMKIDSYCWYFMNFVYMIFVIHYLIVLLTYNVFQIYVCMSFMTWAYNHFLLAIYFVWFLLSPILLLDQYIVLLISRRYHVLLKNLYHICAFICDFQLNIHRASSLQRATKDELEAKERAWVQMKERRMFHKKLQEQKLFRRCQSHNLGHSMEEIRPSVIGLENLTIHFRDMLSSASFELQNSNSREIWWTRWSHRPPLNFSHLDGY